MTESLDRNSLMQATSSEENILDIQKSLVEGKKRSRESTVHSTCVNFDENLKISEMTREKSGDWRDDEPEIAWNCNLYSPVTEDRANNAPWKRKNLYSISNGSHRKYETTFYAEDTQVPEDAFTLTDSPEEKNFINNVRESLATYQETLGTPRTEYPFSALIRLMARVTGRSLLALIYVIINVVPIIEIFPYVLRFVLDKAMDIRKTRDFRQTAMKHAILWIQLLSVYICLVFILGSIVLPLLNMSAGIIAKIVLYD